MDKRYQVFVSSTYKDLKGARTQVIQAIQETNCIPAGMELFPASDEGQFELIKRVIDGCDYYVLIIGGRYGSTDAEGLSYTEKEFDYAVAKGIPVLVFPVEDPGKIPAEDTDLTEKAQKKLAGFRAKATKDRMVKFWKTHEDLAGKVSRSLIQAMTLNPREGWVRARYASDPTALLTFRNRIDELEAELADATSKPPIGASELAQGKDEFKIGYTHYVDRKVTSSELALTWDAIVSILGPTMFDPQAEYDLKSVVTGAIQRHDNIKTDLHVSADSFNTIKVQMLALGLIRKGGPKKEHNSRTTTWCLTPYGVQYVTRLKAVRRDGRQEVVASR